MEMPLEVGNKINEFFSHYPLKSYKKGEMLIMADQPPGYIFHLLAGQVRQYDIAQKGDEIVVNVFKSPAFFPMSWAINSTQNRYFFEASESVEARIAPPEEVVNFLKSNPDVMFDLLSRLYNGVEGLVRRMAHLMGGSARSRLIFELILESRRFGTKYSDTSYSIKISESELGARAGLTRETVSREINELKKIGLVSVKQQHLIISDINSLEKEIGSGL